MKSAKKILIASLFFVIAVLVGVGITLAVEKEERLPGGAPTPTPTGDEWINLFSEENASYWENVTDKTEDIFTIKDGVFHVPGGEGTHYVAWQKQDFSDFILHVEFKLASDTNSGVFFRTSPKDPVYAGMEIQIYDDYKKAPNKNSSGALYDIATPMFSMARPAGEWNTYDITCKGSMLEVVVNGWKVLDIDLASLNVPIGKFDTPLAELPHKGHIILQDHGGEITFRNVLVKPL